MTTRRTAGPKGFAKKKQPRGFLPLQGEGGIDIFPLPWTSTNTSPLGVVKHYERVVKHYTKNIFGSGQAVNTTENLTAGPTKRKR